LALLLIALLSACAWHADTDQHARQFFDEGKDMILSALKRQEKTVPTEIAGVFRRQRALFRSIASGQNSEQLLALEIELHRTSEQTLRPIGRMHDESMDGRGRPRREQAVEELAAAVGDKTWKAASADLDHRMSHHFRE
jgi:hypothetical protein